MEDALKIITKAKIKESRLKEIKVEILNSDKLKAHFEDNPQDLRALRHDRPSHILQTQSHMKNVPEYLLPKKSFGDDENKDLGRINFHKNRKRKYDKRNHNNAKVQFQPFGNHGINLSFQKQRTNPLKSFTFGKK